MLRLAATEGPNWILWTAFKTGQVLLFVLSLALLVAALVLADRKIWAAVQMRRGPNVVGAFGLLQTMADALKFFLQRNRHSCGSDKFLFILAPILGLVMAFAAWAVIPVAPGWVISDINIGVLYVLALSSLGVYGIIIGGWASNSKYPFMGALRSAAQMVSYEVSIGFIILTVIFLSGSMNLTTIVDAQGRAFWNWNMFRLNPVGEYGIWNLLLFPIMFYMGVLFFISALAETNRPPFDLPEAESELVAGYQVEYSSTPFLMFFFRGICEHHAALCHDDAPVSWAAGMRRLNISLPFGLQVLPFIWFFLKTAFLFFMFAMVKAIVPRYRYDQLMRLGWKVFLPTALAAVVIVSTFVVFLGDKAV